MCLCLDLIWTIWDPFSPANRRNKWYYGISIVMSFALVTLMYFIQNEDKMDCVDEYKADVFFTIKSNLLLEMILSLFIVVAIYSQIYAKRRLSRPGVSAPIRNLFIQQHFSYVIVSIIIWNLMQASNYYQLFNPEQ